MSSARDDGDDLFQASKRGDLERVQLFLEEPDADVNAMDQWDNTPLFNAVYGGHTEVAELLLANGARCDAETFVGERCFYGALTPALRKRLQAHNATDFSRTHKHYFFRFLAKLWRDSRCHDVRFVVEDRVVSAPRVVLGARCAVLRRKFLGVWKGRDEIPVPPKPGPDALVAVLRYVVTGRFVLDAQLVADARILAERLRLAPLQAFLADEQVDLTLPGSAPPGRTLVFEDEPVALRDSLAPLADSVCGGAVSDDLKTFAAACSDVEIVCGGADGGEPETRLALPSAFLRGHSEVAAAWAARWHGKTLHVDASPAAARAVVRWCVCGGAAKSLAEAAVAADALALAHEWMLPPELIHAAAGGLGAAVREAGEAEAAMAALPYCEIAGERGRLYAAICDVLALDLAAATTLDAFREAVVESAASIQARQATDSIPFVDDIRTALHALVNPCDEELEDGTSGAVREAAELAVLDLFVERLGLSG